jgi:glyoxylase-like metal-dependent hydrolase (beta-lactamase superfamily II)
VIGWYRAAQVLLTPGHTPGHVSLLEARHGTVFTAICTAGIGRADLPGGDFHQLMRSIREVLFTLPDETIVYPGHGPSTTIGEEKQQNPWLSD